MKAKKVFFDANTIIEIVLERKGMDQVIQLLSQNTGSCYISMLTVHLAVHFGQKYAPLDAIEQLLSEFTILDLTEQDSAWAFANRSNSDYEDALQIAVASRAGCDRFVTFDKQLASDYSNLPKLKVDLL